MVEQRGGGDHLVLLAVGAVVAASAAVTMVGSLAGSLGGSGRPSAGVGEALQILSRLPGNLNDPRQAWPTDDAAKLPGAVAMYGAAAAVLLLIVALSVVGAWATTRRASRRTPRRTPSAAFASARDLRPLVVQEPAPGRVVLGAAHGRLIATLEEHSVLVVGATRSGKTRGFAIPALREWAGPAIVLSAKTDLLHATHAERNCHGPCWVFDPTAVSGLPPTDWSPLAGATTWAGAVQAANAMAKVSGTTSGLGGAGKHWERVAAQLLAPLLLAASTGGLDMGDVVRWVTTKELEEPRVLLDLLGNDAEVALRSMRAYVELEPRARDSAFSTARTVLDVYEDPCVLDAVRGWDLRPERLLDGAPNTLYLLAGSTDQSRLAPVFLALIDEMLRAAARLASERRASTGHPLGLEDGSRSPRLLLLLDEAANIAPLPDLATLASTAGGEGVQLVTIFQDLSQLRHRYGTEWGSIASNHVAKVILPGVTDPETLAYFSNTVGEEEVVSESVSTGAEGRKTTSRSQVRRPVIGQRELRELAQGEGLCLYGSSPPIRLRLRL